MNKNQMKEDKILDYTEKDIAIVGIGCRFPGSSNSVEEFWELIKNGRDALVDIPEDRWSIKEFYNENKEALGKTQSKKGGFIDSFDEFDAKFFGINAREAEEMDPQQRQMLEIVWEALEDAGIKPVAINGSKTGVFIGGFTLDYQILQFSNANEISTHTAVGGMMTMLSNRISYIYNFKGPSMSIDTACSSSLVSIHLACQSLRNNECNLALAGGIELIYTPEYFIAETKGGFLSKDGRCKTFDEDANGYVRGEGGGIIVLKPLKKAIEDNDNIYAVIKESLVNQDGKTAGITVPNGDSQKELLAEVYDRAGINPLDVQYLELHGTGTGVGDPIETNAMGEFFGEGRAEKNRCIISSVKSNIGHLEAASGVASLIKAICILNKKEIAPHIGMKKLNTKIDLNKLMLRIPLQSEEWPDNGKEGIIGINSFGFGGTNAHVILKEFNNELLDNGHVVYKEIPRVLTISAKSKDSLNLLIEKYISFLQKTDESLDNICHSAIFNREKMQKTVAVFGYDKERIMNTLLELKSDGYAQSGFIGEELKDKRLVYVFTGMGPQWFAMGRQLYNENKVFQNMINECSNEFSKYLEWSFIEEFLSDEKYSHIADTEYAQPLIFALQVSLCKMWESMGVTPDAIIGHSVGEVAAFYIAGVYSLSDAVKISYYRSFLQQRLTGKGGMLVVGLSESDVVELIIGKESKISVAAINSNTSVTLSGSMDCLEEVSEELRISGIFNKFLKVTVPYHSVFLEEIKEEFLETIKNIRPMKSKVILYTTADGEYSDGSNLDNIYWWNNVRNTVYFAKAMTKILNEGYQNFIEIGPHSVLANSIKELASEQDKEILVEPTLRRKEAEMDRVYLTYCKLYVAGYPIDWTKVYDGTFKLVGLPKYCWNRERYWKEPEQHMKYRLGMTDHVFLGYRSNSVVPQWNMEVNEYSLPFIKDHCINEMKIIAGAHYVEIAFQMIRNYCNLDVNDVYTLNSIRFHKANFLDDNNTVKMCIIYDEKSGKVIITSSEDGDSLHSSIYFTGEFVRKECYPNRKSKHLTSILDRCCESIDEEKCYQLFEQMNFNYGASFHGIKKVYLGDDEVLAEIHTIEELGVKDMDNILHPVLLDAAFQSFIACQFQEFIKKGYVEIKLPESIESIEVYGKVEGTLYVHSKVSYIDDKKICGDIVIFNSDDEVVAKIENFIVSSLEKIEEESLLSEKELKEWFYGIKWNNQKKIEDELIQDEEEFSGYIILADAFGNAEKLAELLEEKGRKTYVYYADYQNREDIDPDYVIESNRKESYDKLIGKMDELHNYAVIHMWALDIQSHANMNCEYIEYSKVKLVNSLRHMINVLVDADVRFKAWVITRNGVSVSQKDEVDVLQGSAWGMGRVIGHCECIGYWGGNIDLDDNTDITNIVEEIEYITREDEVAYRNNVRYVARLQHIYNLSGNMPVRMYGNKLYIVTGALGALGQVTINWMYEKGARNFVFIGRTSLPGRDEWDKIDKNERGYKNVHFIQELENKGANVRYIAMDIADEESVRMLVQQLKAESLPIGGIFQIAGIIKDNFMANMTQEDFDTVYNPKVKGAWLFNKYLQDEELDFFIMYSSTGSVVTTVGQINYAAANSFMDSLAAYRRYCGKPALSIGWGPWGVGMVKEKNLIEHYKLQRGMNPIYAKNGMQALERLFGQRVCHAVVGGVNWPLTLNNYPSKPILYHYLAREGEKINENEVTDIYAILSESTEENRKNMVMEMFSEITAEIIHAKKDEMKYTEPLNNIGVDSIIAVEIRNRINDISRINISIVDILGGMSIQEICDKYYHEICENIESYISDATEEYLELNDILHDLSGMSEEEIDHLLKTQL